MVEASGIVDAIERNAEYGGYHGSKNQIVNGLLRRYVDKDAISYYNKKSLQDAKSAMKLNPKKDISVSAKGLTIVMNVKNYKAELKKNNVKESDINAISFKNETSSPLFVKYNPINPGLIYKTYHFGEYFWNMAYGKNIPTGEELVAPQTELQQVALLFEFLNIDTQSKGMENFEINFNPDTGLLSTIEGVLERRRFVEALELDSKVDFVTIQKYLQI